MRLAQLLYACSIWSVGAFFLLAFLSAFVNLVRGKPVDGEEAAIYTAIALLSFAITIALVATGLVVFAA